MRMKILRFSPEQNGNEAKDDRNKALSVSIPFFETSVQQVKLRCQTSRHRHKDRGWNPFKWNRKNITPKSQRRGVGMDHLIE